MKKSINQSVRYRAFIADRNRALETLLQKRLNQVDSVMTDLKAVITEVSVTYFRHAAPYLPHTFANRLEPVFQLATNLIVEAIRSLRRSSYLLAYAGEAEAIGRALGNKSRTSITKHDLGQIAATETPSGGALEHRITVALSKLKHRIIDAMNMAILLSDSVEDGVARIESAFPKHRKIVQPKRVLKGPKLKEADKPKPDFEAMDFTLIDDSAWQEMVRDYSSEYIPFSRTGEDLVKVGSGKEAVERYSWEVEQEITQDFVEKVRGGAIKAANDNGINDFVWIAIVDDKTDECCLWRDGLTTTEIAAMLSSDKQDDECQVQTPPAHFSCRCDLAPMSDNMPDKEPTDLGDFETWLE